MSDQIDPAFKAAYRETQGQPVDAVGREPEDDDGFVTTSDYVDAFLGVGTESWKQTATEYAQEVYNLRTALAEKDARIVELEAQIISAWNAFGAGPKAEPPFDREDIDDLPIWAAGDLATQIREAEKQLTASRAECEGLRAALEAAKDFIALEYADARQEQYGEWLAPEARKVFGLICEALASHVSRLPVARPIDETIVEALEIARHELWKMGATESEHHALWHVRRALASISQPAKGEREGGGV